MEEIISQLTHDNSLLDEQWSEIYDQLRSVSPSNDGKTVLHALVDYILADPIDPPPDQIKYSFIDMVIDELNSSEISLDTVDLVNAFLRVLQSSSIDPWRLHFLTIIYEKFRLGERISSHTSKDQFLKEILRHLQTKNFETHEENWRTFLIGNLFSSLIDESNALNQTDRQTQFEQFYKHAVDHSAQSSIWSEITTIFRETLFPDQVTETNSMTDIDNCISQKRYDDAGSIVSHLDFKTVDLNAFLRSLIRYCSMEIEDRDSFCSNFLIRCVFQLVDVSEDKQYASLYFELALAILKLSSLKAPDTAYRLLRQADFYPWKDLIHGLFEMFKSCIAYDTISCEEYFSDLNELENILSIIVKKSPTYPQLAASIQPLALDTILRWGDVQCNGGHHVYRMGCVLFECIQSKQLTEEICVKLIDVLQGQVNLNWKDNPGKTRFFFNEMFGQLAERLQQLKILSHSTHMKISNLCLSILDHPLYDEEQNMTSSHALLATILLRTAQSINEEKEARLYERFLDRLYNEANERDNPTLYQWWIGFWVIAGSKFPNFARDHCEQFLEYTLATKEANLMGILVANCLQQSAVIGRHFDALVQMLFTDNGANLTCFSYLFTSIVQQYPEMISSEHLQQILTAMEQVGFSNYLETIVYSLSAVANYQPQLFDHCREKLMKFIIERQSLPVLECLRKYLIASMIIHRSENRARESLNLLFELLHQQTCSNELRKAIIYICLLIGLKYKQIVRDRREDFVKLKGDLVVHYIDQMMISKDEELIIKQGEEEIESIERKIKSHEIVLPIWTRNVTKLLNVRCENDWRLLGKQLGFSASEIKYWAMQNDPCLILFKEWFRIYQTDQAIAGLLKALTDIKRLDAEQIIRQACASSILPLDLKRIPPILLSFHSSERKFIVQLKDHLNEAGYTSQLDDEQTDLNTVEMHIQGAKVVICVINTSYSQSENCAKHCQWNLKMKKPSILLHIEEQTWPPEGRLKSMLQESLYIAFPHDKEGSEWPETKFLELLTQIRSYVAPDSDSTSAHYRHWFVPRLDTLIFFQKNNLSTSFTNIPLVVSHPQIVLSYQWDCQQDALNLYKQLTQYGYRVWLDIFQMGGGESLLEKVHFSIHQCSCLLACITPKYMKSVHYENEFLVAKNSNKPILCLWLEETNPWPPNGVELPLFIGKFYIDFRNDNNHDRWTGKSFSLLLAQLEKLIPQIQTDKPRHLLDMQRPTSAMPNNIPLDQSSRRRSSAPIIPQSSACSLM